jgi:hypothetical protein
VHNGGSKDSEVYHVGTQTDSDKDEVMTNHQVQEAISIIQELKTKMEESNLRHSTFER